MSNKNKTNLDYNVPDRKPCFNSRNHVNWTDTARQIVPIENECANNSHEVIEELIRVTRANMEKN